MPRRKTPTQPTRTLEKAMTLRLDAATRRKLLAAKKRTQFSMSALIRLAVARLDLRRVGVLRRRRARRGNRVA